MQLLVATEIRDFKVRANYCNQRALLSSRALHRSKKEHVASIRPGYSPAVVDLELDDGSTSSITVSEVDIPGLCDEDSERAKRHLSLILRSRSGDREAAQVLFAASQEAILRGLE